MRAALTSRIGVGLTCSFVLAAVPREIIAREQRLPIEGLEKPAPALHAGLSESYGKLPLSFEANTGQADPEARFISRGHDYSLAVTSTGTVLTLSDPPPSHNPRFRGPKNDPPHSSAPPSVLRMSVVGANPAASVTGQDELAGRVNYLIGNDPAHWRTNIPVFGKVKCEAVYPGVDVVYYGNQQHLEYDFVVAPGADPKCIRLRFEGAHELTLNEEGDLVITLEARELRQRKPFVYQTIAGTQRQIKGSYAIVGSQEVAFEIGAYDHSIPLVIDPVLAYSTLFPLGANRGRVQGIAIDPTGNAYIVGSLSVSFGMQGLPPPPLFPRNPGGDIFGSPYNDAFVAKLNASGSAVVWWTYLGGSGVDDAWAVAVDGAGSACVMGRTTSVNFPTLNAFQPTRNGPGDAFVTKFNAAGTALVYSTYLGGSQYDDAFTGGIEVDSAGHIYLAGNTESRGDFPVTDKAFQKTSNYGGFLTKLNPAASGAASLLYSTAVDMSIEGLAIDNSGHAYLAGSDNVGSFPTTGKAFQKVGRVRYEPGCFCDVRYDALIVGLETNPATCTTGPEPGINCRESLLYASYLGGTDGQFSNADRAMGIAVDDAGRIYVTGKTGSTDFPVTPSAFQSASKADGRYQAFLTVLDPNPATCTADPTREINCLEALVYSTYLGGSSLNRGGDEGWDLALDAQGNVYLTGVADSFDFPVKAPLQPFRDRDAFVAKINPKASGDASLVWSTFLGGASQEDDMRIAVDAAGNAYVSGTTSSADFPTTEGAFYRNQGQTARGFITKISENVAPFLVSAISPERGGDTGAVTATVYGVGFAEGATVNLARTGQANVPGEKVSASSSGQLTARFDLAGKEKGLWDVVVTNPDGLSRSLPGAFSVEAGKKLSGRVEISGRTNFRPGGTGRVIVTYSNPGNVDVLLPILIRIPEGIGFSLPVPLLHIPLVPVVGPVDMSELAQSFQRPDDPSTPQNEAETIIPIIVNVPPGFTGGIPVNLRHPNTNCSGVQIRASVGDPIETTQGSGSACLGALAGLAADLLTDIIPGAECLKSAFELLVKANTDLYTGQPSSLSSWIGSFLLGAVTCAADIFPVGKAIKIAVKVVDLVIGKGVAIVEAINSCSSFLPMQPGFSGPGTSTLDTACVGSRDPNDKIGPPGAGTGHHISKAQALPYLILFENKPDATAPAQTVVITDQLDASTMDLSSLSLGFIAFGDKMVIPPYGLSEFTTNIDLRPGNNLVVKVEAKLVANVLTWRFESIDPATNQPTDDPLAGFLPPNTNPPAGDGAVFFTVMPKEALAHGTEIRNQASIVFDFNDAILTPEWLNTIDDSKPASQVTALSGSQTATSFPVTWSGTDTGSAIQMYTIFVSGAGGPFTEWLTNTTATSATFPGRPNTAYAFYSVAQDHAGNREEAPALPDSITITPIPLAIRRELNEVIIEWTIPGRLQSSQTLKGDFLDVPGASNPHRVDHASGPVMFWRVVP